MDIIRNSYSPYSGFPVGAVAVSTDGRMFPGVNVENASYGLTSCAERNAVFNAVASGATAFTMVMLMTDTEDPVTPCGACRQVLAEFCPPDMPVICETLNGRSKTYQLKDLIPFAFGL